MNRLSEWLQVNMKLNPQLQVSIALIIGLWLIRYIVLKLAYRNFADVHIRYRWRKFSSYLTFSLGLFLLGRIWFQGFHSVATFLGLLSAGLAIALKDILTNLAGWAFILWRRPLAVGDRVQIGDTKGDVIDIRIFEFTLMEIGNWVEADQSTGRVVHIPNGKIFNEPLANYSKGFQYIWNEVSTLITFESDWQKAKNILLNIAKKHAEHLSETAQQKVQKAARKFLIFYSILTPTVYTRVKECGVSLTIRYLCEPRKRRNTEQAIWEDVLLEFGKCNDIDFAYPTQRFFNNQLEGKIK